jgi:nucleoside-diphosphate-sugar epimerase
VNSTKAQASTEPDPATGPAASVVVVTGASGWLGQNLVRTLARTRQRVRCLVPVADEAPVLEIVSPVIEAVVGDIRDPATVDRLFDDVGTDATVFHAAAVIHPRHSVRELFDVNVGGTQLVLDRARRSGAGRLVHVSSNSPFGVNPGPDHVFTEDSPYAPYLGYGQSKQEAEQLVERAHERGDLANVVLRAPWFYGPYQPPRQTRFFAAVRRGRFPRVGDGRQKRSMVYTDNLVQGLLLAETSVKASGNAYWIADAEPYELREILATVRRALAAEGLVLSGPAALPLPRLAARAAESIDRFVQGRGRYVQPLHVLGELNHTIACDISRARDELGYDPAVGLEDGMRASIRWCLEHGAPI